MLTRNGLGKLLGAVLLAFALVAGVWILMGMGSARAAGGLTVEIIAGYNLVVDSNVESPSTYAPSVATVIGKFCNEGSTAVQNVMGYIGDYNPVTPGDSTPGLYPRRYVTNTTPTVFATQHPHLVNGVSGDYYAFEHIGGRIGTTDATRVVNDLAPGECKYQYWHFTYPRRGNNPTTGAHDNSGDAVWGATRLYEDDLWLEFDIWATGSGGANNNATWRMTMRNEISAMANKIEPNPNGRWFNTMTDTVRPGDVITSNGILYELGNINKGFDNDGDFTYDYNAWLQPVGDPAYDPSCFRLIRTSGVITVSRSGGQPDLYIPFVDTLYFTNLPPDNTGVLGRVYYTFQALDGPCSTRLTPYQEVASGADNEKFNGDFGAGIPPVESSEPEVAIDKNGNITVTPGSSIEYTVDFANQGDANAGLPLNSMPVMISDTIPSGTTLTGAPEASVGVIVRYSTDNGATYTTTVPAPISAVTNIQWWLTDTLASGASGTITFSVQVDASFPPVGTPPLIENCAEASFGSAAPFAESCATTLVAGANAIGDFVWRDDDADGRQDIGETGIPNVTVSLYWDDGDGVWDSDDLFISSTETDSSGNYLFENLPDGDFIVVVDGADLDLPFGYNHTTPEMYAVLGLGTTVTTPYLNADFGFGPVLMLDKERGAGDPVYEGDLISYTIALENTRPGDGTGAGSPCVYEVWATTQGPNDGAVWINPSGILGLSGPDGIYASHLPSNNADVVAGTGFSLGSRTDTIEKVEVLYSLYVQNQFVDDDFKLQYWYNSALVERLLTFADVNPYGPAQTNQGLLTWDVTTDRAWDWSDFVGNTLEVGFWTKKGGGQGDTNIYIDAVGFRVTTGVSCGGPNDTIVTLPLTDTYDAARLQFVSAEPGETNVATGGAAPYANTGSIYWRNLGPLYAGQTKVVTVTFKALEPLNNASETISNTAMTQNARFSNGRPVHAITDTVTNTLEPTGAIGDYVWRDQDGEGDQDEGAGYGIPGVVVSLTPPAGVDLGNGAGVAITMTTDANGAYLFDGLRYSGDYIVAVDTATLPVGTGSFVNTYDRDGNKDSQATVTLDHDSTTGDDKIFDVDFGYDLPSIIDGTVWHDWNRSATGTPDDGENGLANVTVTLRDGGGSIVATTTTDENGYYQFIGNYDGAYTVEVTPSTGDMSTGSWTQSYDEDGIGSAHVVSVSVTDGGYANADYSYYLTGTGSIGTTVYTDWNGNGSQGAGEEGIPGITVSLYVDSNGDGTVDPDIDALIATQVTDASGWYDFTGLPAANYLVVVDESDPQWPHALYSRTEDNYGVTDGKAPIALGAGQTIVDADFGYLPYGFGSIGDYVWLDSDGDGIQDDIESGLKDITVTLYEDSNGNGQYDAGVDAMIAATSTITDGYYLFDDLPAGNYLVDVDTADADLPTDGYGEPFVLSTDNDLLAVTLAVAEAYLDADFGFTAGGTIGDTIWQDDDADGIQDDSESGIDNVTVRLYIDVNGDGNYDAGTDTLYGTAYTNASGVYSFTSLPAADYVVVVVTSTLPSASWTQTGDPDLTRVCVGVECDSETGVTLGAGQIYLAADFGYRPPGVIGDYVWYDADGDGVQDEREYGISGMVITLTLQGGAVITTVTDSDGYYSFGNVPDGTHTVTCQQPEGMTETYDRNGGLDNQASVTITGGSRDDTIDFGYRWFGDYDISGTVFFDVGGTTDGASDLYNLGSDVPYNGVTVYLWDSDRRLISATTTTATGVYTFTNLPDGSYTVSVETASPQIDGLDLTGSVNPGYTYDPVTIAGADVTGEDFGFFGPVDFGDLPDTYGTTMASNGAGHILGNLRLGLLADSEGDGAPTGDATGDGADDSDGIAYDPDDTWTNGVTVHMTATVTGNYGYLVGFFDWNGDGNFDDMGETVIFGNMDPGKNPLTLNIPIWANPGVDYLNLRFRLYDRTGQMNISATGLATNGEVEDYQQPFEAPTAVDIASFAALSTVDGIQLSWETANELDSLGFNLLRATSEFGPWSSLNANLIPAQHPGSAFGATYLWLDPDVQSGVKYYYLLQEIVMQGGGVTHGPVAIEAGVPTAVAVSEFGVGVSWDPLGVVGLIGGAMMLAWTSHHRKTRSL